MFSKILSSVCGISFGASLALAVSPDLPDPSTWQIPETPSNCFDDKDYCITDQIFPASGSIGNHIGVQIFMLYPRESGETDQELSDRIYKKYQDFDSWDDYSATKDPTGKYLKYKTSAGMNDVAAAAPFNFDMTNKGYHYVNYDVAGPLATRFRVEGTYEHTLLEQPISSEAFLSATLELVTENRDDNVSKRPLAELMPVPAGVTAPKAPQGVKWHWGYMHILPFADDADYVVVILDMYQQPEISFLPSLAVDPAKRSLLAIMGGMLEVDIDFNDLK